MATRARTATKPIESVEYPQMSPRLWFRRLGWRHLVLVLGCLFALYPVIWMVSAAFNGVDNLASARLIPEQLTTDNFTALFTDPDMPFLLWTRNTWVVATVAASGNLVLAALAAYAFSRMRFQGRRIGLLSLLLIQIFPQYLAFVALFLLMQSIGQVAPAVGLDTLAGLVLVFLGGSIGFNAFLMKGFMDTIPSSLDESARVDGATDWQVFSRIVLPLTRPVLAVVFIITFVTLYSELVVTQTLIRSASNFTLAVGLDVFTTAQFASKWGLLAAGALLGALPIVITFLIAQRHIISGLTQGAVKG